MIYKLLIIFIFDYGVSFKKVIIKKKDIWLLVKDQTIIR